MSIKTPIVVTSVGPYLKRRILKGFCLDDGWRDRAGRVAHKYCFWITRRTSSVRKPSWLFLILMNVVNEIEVELFAT